MMPSQFAQSEQSLTSKVGAFCEQRLRRGLPSREFPLLRAYLFDLAAKLRRPPKKGRRVDWTAIASASAVPLELLRPLRHEITYVLDAIERDRIARRGTKHPRIENTQPIWSARKAYVPRNSTTQQQNRACPGAKPRAIEAHPAPLFDILEEPTSFADALSVQAKRHGDTYHHLHRAIFRTGDTIDVKTVRSWMIGAKAPRSIKSLEVLGRIEERYRLPRGYFSAKLPDPSRAFYGHEIALYVSADAWLGTSRMISMICQYRSATRSSHGFGKRS